TKRSDRRQNRVCLAIWAGDSFTSFACVRPTPPPETPRTRTNPPHPPRPQPDGAPTAHFGLPRSPPRFTMAADRSSRTLRSCALGLWEKLRGELIDIIEWTEPPGSELLAYRFPRYNNEIKYGAKLTVREGQAAAFVNEGQLADVYGPGTYTLETQNMPILSTLRGWKYGFHSPFKAEVYFISTRRWTDQKWGTQNPIMLRDPEFGPVRVRAFGTYAVQVVDPATFLPQLVATDPSFETYEITNQLRNTIVARFTDALGRAKLPVLDLAGNYERVAKVALEGIAPDLAQMGLALP